MPQALSEQGPKGDPARLSRRTFLGLLGLAGLGVATAGFIPQPAPTLAEDVSKLQPTPLPTPEPQRLSSPQEQIAELTAPKATTSPATSDLTSQPIPVVKTPKPEAPTVKISAEILSPEQVFANLRNGEALEDNQIWGLTGVFLEKDASEVVINMYTTAYTTSGPTLYRSSSNPQGTYGRWAPIYSFGANFAPQTIVAKGQDILTIGLAKDSYGDYRLPYAMISHNGGETFKQISPPDSGYSRYQETAVIPGTTIAFLPSSLELYNLSTDKLIPLGIRGMASIILGKVDGNLLTVYGSVGQGYQIVTINYQTGEIVSSEIKNKYLQIMAFTVQRAPDGTGQRYFTADPNYNLTVFDQNHNPVAVVFYYRALESEGIPELDIKSLNYDSNKLLAGGDAYKDGKYINVELELDPVTGQIVKYKTIENLPNRIVVQPDMQWAKLVSGVQGFINHIWSSVGTISTDPTAPDGSLLTSSSAFCIAAGLEDPPPTPPPTPTPTFSPTSTNTPVPTATKEPQVVTPTPSPTATAPSTLTPVSIPVNRLRTYLPIIQGGVTGQ